MVCELQHRAQSREQQHTILSGFSLFLSSSLVIVMLLCVCSIVARVLILRSRSLAPLTCWTETAKHLVTLSERTPLFKKSIFRCRRRRWMTFATTRTIACVHYGRNQMKQFLIRRKSASCVLGLNDIHKRFTLLPYFRNTHTMTACITDLNIFKFQKLHKQI